MLSISSSEDEGGPGSSGRPLGGWGVSNSILEVLRDGRGGVESSKEGVASIGVAACGEEARDPRQQRQCGWEIVIEAFQVVESQLAV
jgi:hypothetical protein